MSRTWVYRAAVVFLALIWGCTLYRAATQSISIDEAFSLDRFVSKSVVEMMNGEYEANNHVLYTLLAQLSISLFGVSELAMRVPALLGGAIFFTSLFFLCKLLFSSRLIFVLVIAATSLNPFVLDYLCIARGYGLASGLYLTSLWAVAASLMSAKRSRWWQLLAGVSLGLCISANLTFLFPGLALVVIFFLLILGQKTAVGWGSCAGAFVFPFLLIATLINGLPLSHSTPNHFYFGSDNLKMMMDGFLSICFYRDHSPIPRFGRQFSALAQPLIFLFSAAISLMGAFLAVRSFREKQVALPLALTGGVLAVTLMGIGLAKVLFATLYPYRRTGIYLVLVFVLGAGALLQYLERGRGRLVVKWAAIALAAPVLILFVAQTNLRMYGEWPFDENFRTVVEKLAEQHAANPKNNVHFGINQVHRFQLYFYRTTMGLNWIAPMDFNPVDGNYDYYILRPDERGIIERRGLKVIFREPASYTILAASPN